jgi:hypothetical protein
VRKAEVEVKVEIENIFEYPKHPHQPNNPLFQFSIIPPDNKTINPPGK